MMKLLKNEKGMRELEELLRKEMEEKLESLRNEKDFEIASLKLVNKNLDKKITEKDNYNIEMQKVIDELKSRLLKDMEIINNSISSQASISEELTATVEEINATISNIAERVNSASENAKSNGSIMDKFNDDIEGIYNDTDTLNSKIQNISKIVATINEISNQTNLLSLNASIESARAGEAGKGFSVVASEIRKLAEQTKISNLEIKKIIEEIQIMANNILVKTYEGKENSQKLTDSNVARISNIEEINISMSEVVAGIEQMSSAMQEQSASIIEIANETDKVTKMIKV